MCSQIMAVQEKEYEEIGRFFKTAKLFYVT